MKHLILVQLGHDHRIGKIISKTQYFKTSFDKELGDEVSFNGEKFKVGVKADSRDAAINGINKFLKQQNSIIRKYNRNENRKADMFFAKIMSEAVESIHKDY